MRRDNTYKILGIYQDVIRYKNYQRFTKKIFVDMRLQIVFFAAQNEGAISLLSHCETNPPPPSKYKGWKGFVNSYFFLCFFDIRYKIPMTRRTRIRIPTETRSGMSAFR